MLVDAENVRRSRWPNVEAAELVRLCDRWAEADGHRVVVVFDGRAPGDVLGERALDDRCEVVGTGAESADDWLVRRARHCHAHGATYWLVTSDRALRSAAGGHAERVLGGGSFVRRLHA